MSKNRDGRGRGADGAALSEGNAAVDGTPVAGHAERMDERGPRAAAPRPASFGDLAGEVNPPPADSPSADSPPADAPTGNLSMILDIPVTVSVELGRTRMAVGDLLRLGQGSVVELTKLAGEPMEIYVNDKLLARGEAVVVNEKFGVKLTDIVSPTERINNLK